MKGPRLFIWVLGLIVMLVSSDLSFAQDRASLEQSAITASAYVLNSHKKLKEKFHRAFQKAPKPTDFEAFKLKGDRVWYCTWDADATQDKAPFVRDWPPTVKYLVAVPKYGFIQKEKNSSVSDERVMSFEISDHGFHGRSKSQHFDEYVVVTPSGDLIVEISEVRGEGHEVVDAAVSNASLEAKKYLFCPKIFQKNITEIRSRISHIIKTHILDLEKERDEVLKMLDSVDFAEAMSTMLRQAAEAPPGQIEALLSATRRLPQTPYIKYEDYESQLPIVISALRETFHESLNQLRILSGVGLDKPGEIPHERYTMLIKSLKNYNLTTRFFQWSLFAKPNASTHFNYHQFYYSSFVESGLLDELTFLLNLWAPV